WWLVRPREGDVFAAPVWMAENARTPGVGRVEVPLALAVGEGSPVFDVRAPVVRRYADPVRGDVSVPLAAAPAITLSLDREVELAPAGQEIERSVLVHVRSADSARREVSVRLALPQGLTADSVQRTVSVPRGGEAFVSFRVGGRVPPGQHEVRASAESEGER